MRTKHPFPEITLYEELETTVQLPEKYANLGELMLGKHAPAAPERVPTMHDGENRRTRRRAVAEFAGPKELGTGLRRKLLEQRQARASGTLDPELRRLQRAAIKRKAKNK